MFPDWFETILRGLGLWEKSAKILFLELDNNGKTTLVHVLKKDRMAQDVPALYQTSEDSSTGTVEFSSLYFDGTHQVLRGWRNCFNDVDAIAFLIDASDSEEFVESEAQLRSLLAGEQLSDWPVLIIVNKSMISKQYPTDICDGPWSFAEQLKRAETP